MASLGKFFATAGVGLIKVYQRFLSPLLGPSCRFYPTCSAYAIEALQRHGPWRGGWLALRRLLRCHPLGPAWHHDPVPKSPRDSACGDNTNCRHTPQ